VHAECLAYALDQPDTLSGLCAGTTQTDRHRMREDAAIVELAPAVGTTSSSESLASDRRQVAHHCPSYAASVLG
jgi:hypothetical protein